jgi:RNA-binding protein
MYAFGARKVEGELVTLKGYQKRFLRARAHALEPSLAIGRTGLTEAWVAELGRELDRHELVKVRLSPDREERSAELARVLEDTGSMLVATVGRVATLYRASSTASAPIELPRRGVEDPPPSA